MKKEAKLINKVKRLLKRIKCPRWLHHFGPKMYEFWQHIFALFVRANCGMSYRRTCRFLRELGFKVASKSTLQRYSMKIRLPLWQKIFRETVGEITDIVAIDGTGLAKTKPSSYYIKRIDSKIPFSKGYHFSILADTKGKIQSLRIRKNYTHDVKDVKNLYKNLVNKPKIILMDKGYDAEWIHKFFRQRGIISIAPPRKNAKRGTTRRMLKKDFPKKLYGKRNIVESVFHAMNQKYGSSVSSKKIASARSEVYCRAILHNIFLKRIISLGTNPYMVYYCIKRF